MEGAATCGWAIIAFFILPDFPSNTKRLTDRERHLAITRLHEPGQTHSEEQISSKQALLQAVKSWKVWLLVAGYMVIVGSSTLSYFYPTLVQGLGYSAVDAQFMVVPIYGQMQFSLLEQNTNTDHRIAVAFVAVVVTGYFGDKYPRKRGLIISGWLTCSLIAAVVICAVYNFKARYGLLVIMAAGLWATNACALSYAASTFSDMPRETRGVALALVNALGNLAQIYGYVLREGSNPNGMLTSFPQGISVPRGGPSKVLARIRRDCRNVCFWCDGLCISACLVPEVHPVEVFDTTRVSQQNIMIIIQIDAIERFSLISGTPCVISSTSAQAVTAHAEEMLLGSHVCISDLNGEIIRPTRKNAVEVAHFACSAQCTLNSSTKSVFVGHPVCAE